MLKYNISITKFEEGNICEDASISGNNFIAVSDGAGGGGIYADKWSQCLVGNIPSTPLTSIEEVNMFLDGFWEDFYSKYEEIAKSKGGLILEKFYDEGSFATLAVCWKIEGENKVHYLAYGDSVVFCYNRKTDQLKHTYSELADFVNPPYLINWRDELDKEGAVFGSFETDENDIIFIASDALSHYLLMMYIVLTPSGKNVEELDRAIETINKNVTYILTANNMIDSIKIEFWNDVLKPILIATSEGEESFKEHIKELINKNLIANDDYSLAFVTDSVL